jgi:hypothetical protein
VCHTIAPTSRGDTRESPRLTRHTWEETAILPIMAAENERVLRHYLAEIRAEVDATEAALEDLRTQQRVLEQLLARESESGPTRALDTPRDGTTDHIIPTDESVPVLTDEEQQWQGLTITKAVTRVLDEASYPMSPAQIVAYLNSVGLTQKDSESVRGALAWLKRKGIAKALGYAQWALAGGSVDQRPRQEAPTTSSSEDSDTDAVSRNGQDMHANSSNTEPMSGQPLTDDAPAPMADEVDPLKPAADAVIWQTPTPSIRKAILPVIRPGEDVTVGDVVDRLKNKYRGINANRNSVSNELGRWAKEGKLERPAHGIYRRVIMNHPNGDHGRNV